jgi:hypothetical protein
VDSTIDLYYAGTDLGRLFAGPSGTNWQPVLGPANSAITDIKIDPNDPATIYVVLASGRIWRLRRGSPTPTTVNSADITSNLPSGIFVQTVAVSRRARPPLIIYAGTTRGVYQGRSIDGGTGWIWSPYSHGMPLADVVDLDVHPVTAVMRAATWGRSAFQIDSA